MTRIVEEFVSAELMERGIYLSVEGSENYGWVRDDALKVVEPAEQAGLLVLGGNVWLSVGGRYRHAFDNWYCQPSSDQQRVDVARCATTARDYISSYRHAAGEPQDRVLFEIVCRR